MAYEVGDEVLLDGCFVYEVEWAYTNDLGDPFLVLVGSDESDRLVVAENRVKPVPPPEDPVRREAVDLILDYNGVSRGDLFEYPYNAHESRKRIKDAEALLDELLVVLGQ